MAGESKSSASNFRVMIDVRHLCALKITCAYLHSMTRAARNNPIYDDVCSPACGFNMYRCTIVFSGHSTSST